MLRNSGWLNPKGEQLVTEMVEHGIINAIKNKYNVIIDQTNVNIKNLKPFIKFCEKLADVEFVLFDIDLETAIDRDSKRERSVGETVIKRMYKNYLDLINSDFDFNIRKKKAYIVDNITWNPNINLPNAILVDIDGTIAHMQGKRSPFDWNKVNIDEVDEYMKETINVYHKSGYKIIFITGRDGISYNDTFRWLKNNDIQFDYLYTKPCNDYRKDIITKKEIYDNNIKDKFNILCVYDDRIGVTEMWRNLGLKCYQVAEGDF